jgi:glycyl-tRNA synthetase
MSAAEETAGKMQDELDALNAQITKQGSAVRQLKKDGASADAIDEAVKALQALKISQGDLSEKVQGDEPGFNRKSFDELIIRKMFVVPSFEIHGGVKGLFDLGPPACGLKVCNLKGTSKIHMLAINAPFEFLTLLSFSFISRPP